MRPATVRVVCATLCLIAGGDGIAPVQLVTVPSPLREEHIRGDTSVHAYITSPDSFLLEEGVKAHLPVLFTAPPAGTRCGEGDESAGLMCGGPGFNERMNVLLNASLHGQQDGDNVECMNVSAPYVDTTKFVETSAGRLCETIRIRIYNDDVYDIFAVELITVTLETYASALFRDKMTSTTLNQLLPSSNPTFTISPSPARLKIWTDVECARDDPCVSVTVTGMHLSSGDFTITLALEGDTWDLNNFHVDSFRSLVNEPTSFNHIRDSMLKRVYYPADGKTSQAQLTFLTPNATGYGLDEGKVDIIEICGGDGCAASVGSKQPVKNPVRVIVTEPWPACSGANFYNNSCAECAPGYYGQTCEPCADSIDDICSGNGWCKEPGAPRCYRGCADGVNGTGLCMCRPGWEGEFCDQQQLIAATGRYASTGAGGTVLIQVLAGGSPAAPITAVTQLQFFILLAGEECAPEELRNLVSKITRLLEPLYDKIEINPHIDEDAKHLFVAYILLLTLFGLHAFVTSVVYIMKKNDGWDMLDACNTCRFPNLQILVIAGCLENAISSSVAVLSRASEQHPAVCFAGALFIIAYLLFIYYLHRALSATDPESSFPKAQYIDRNVANTSQNVARIVYTSKRAAKMPSVLVWVLPLGFWTSEHLPERGYCKRWGYFFEEYTEEGRLYTVSVLTRLVILSVPLGLRLKGEDICRGKMWALLVVSALFALHFMYRRPYSSRGSNFLQCLVLLSNVFILGAIIADIGAEDSTAYIYLLVCAGVMIVCAVWNAALFIFGKTLYKVSHFVSHEDQAANENHALLEEHGMQDADCAFIRDEALEEVNRKVVAIVVDHCGKLIIHNQGLGLCCLGGGGTGGNPVCWSEIRNGYLLYYEDNQRVTPRGAVLLPLTRILRKKPGLCSCGEDDGPRLAIKDIVTGRELIISVGPEECDLELENWGKFLMLYSSQAPPEQGEGPVFSEKVRSQYEDIDILGHGAFGEVTRVRDVETRREYALKTLHPRGNDKNNKVFNEIAILQLVRHPFLVSLYEAILDVKPDGQHIYLVMQLLVGGDLATHLRQKKNFSLAHTTFYAAQIALALEHLHANNILYRDLKPANVVLDQVGRGNAVLIDMGIAHTGARGHGNVEFEKAIAGTFCGTPYYMAPEILNSWVYDNAVDWWAFGIVIYEMLVGTTPFESEQQNLTYQQIKTRPPLFPRGFPENVKNLVKLLLEKLPTHRLTDAKKIKMHDFFADIDFSKLVKGELLPPEMPPLERTSLTPQHPPNAFHAFPGDVHVTPGVAPVEYNGLSRSSSSPSPHSPQSAAGVHNDRTPMNAASAGTHTGLWPDNERVDGTVMTCLSGLSPPTSQPSRADAHPLRRYSPTPCVSALPELSAFNARAAPVAIPSTTVQKNPIEGFFPSAKLSGSKLGSMSASGDLRTSGSVLPYRGMPLHASHYETVDEGKAGLPSPRAVHG